MACAFRPAVGPCGQDASLDELREENKRLRQQLKRAELERDVLKKATAYFAQESL
jgi:transposase